MIQRPRSDSIDRDSEFGELWSVQKRVTCASQNVALDLRASGNKFDGELLARSAHGVPVSIDHDGWRESVKIVSAREGEAIGQGYLEMTSPLTSVTVQSPRLDQADQNKP